MTAASADVVIGTKDQLDEILWRSEDSKRANTAYVARDLQPGDWMLTPRGSVHQFSNPHSQRARALVVLTPDIGAQYFRDVGAIINAGGPTDRNKLVEVMSKYGLVPARPRCTVAAELFEPADSGPASPRPLLHPPPLAPRPSRTISC